MPKAIRKETEGKLTYTLDITMEVLRVTEQEGTRNSTLPRNSIRLDGKQSEASQIIKKGS